MSDNLPAPQDSRVLIYQSDSGETRLEVRLQDETVWLTQNLMAELYRTTKQNISQHIQNIYDEGELALEMFFMQACDKYGTCVRQVWHTCGTGCHKYATRASRICMTQMCHQL